MSNNWSPKLDPDQMLAEEATNIGVKSSHHLTEPVFGYSFIVFGFFWLSFVNCPILRCF